MKKFASDLLLPQRNSGRKRKEKQDCTNKNLDTDLIEIVYKNKK